MERTVSRRVFVGAVAAGIPVVAGSASHSFAHSSTGQPHIHRVDGATDAVFEHATRQLAAIVNKVCRTGATAEDARLAAAHVSTLAVYGRHIRIDTQTSDAVRALIQAKGRDAVLDLTLDRARLVAQSKKCGVDLDERWLTIHPPDRITRTKVLDDLARFGVTGMFAGVAADFAHIAAEIERRSSRATGIRRVQSGDSWRADFCAQLWLNVSVQSAQAAMLCAAMIYMPGMEAQCAFAQTSVLFYLAIYHAMCL